MYCFSQICRICLGEFSTEFMSLHSFDFDKIRIHDKFRYCVPEIECDDSQLPENVCNNCRNLLQQLYNFKLMCINNTNILYKHVSKLSGNSLPRSDLYIKMDEVTMENETMTIEKQSSDEIPKFSISLNQWDLFETKYTCRCIKNSSFSENPADLCKNCEGELLGFRLSKIKVGTAETRYNASLIKSQLDSDEGNSNFSRADQADTNDKNYERGFDYNDILLCKAHVNGVNKQINDLNATCETEEVVNTSFEDVNRTDTSENKKFNCPLCDKSYTRRYTLLQHYATHPECRFYYCPNCNNRFILKEHLQQHLIRKHRLENDTLNLSLNNAVFKSSNKDDKIYDDQKNVSLSNIKADLNSSDENLVCGTCDKVFNHKSQLAIHLLTHFGKKNFKCTTCGKGFFNKQNFVEHKKVHNGIKKFECDQCGKTYNYKSNLRRHKHIHRGHYLCSVCNEQFAEKDVLVEHIFEKHSKPKVEKSYACQSCSKIFNHIDQLNLHELFAHPKHNTESKKSSDKTKPFSCRFCSKKFFKPEKAKVHELSHGKLKNSKFAAYKIKTENGLGHFCPICKRTYSIKTNIRKHIETHSNSKITKCSVCGKKFTNRFLMREHIKIQHRNEIPFKCNLCDNGYLTKSNLIRHYEQSHSN